MNRKNRRLFAAFTVSAVLATGCASEAGRGERRVPAEAPPQLFDLSGHIRKDGTLSNTEIAPTTSAAQASAQPGTPPSVAQIIQNQPMARVAPAIKDQFGQLLTKVVVGVAPEAKPDRAALGCNLARGWAYFRKHDANPWGLAAQDEKTGSYYYPELMAFYAVSSYHELDGQSLRVVYQEDGANYSNGWSIDLTQAKFKTNIDGLKVRGPDGKDITPFGAGYWLVVAVPQRLSDELRGLQRDSRGEIIVDASGQPIRHYRHPAFFIEPENMFVTPETFTNRSEAIGATVEGCDLSFRVQKRRGGCVWLFKHDRTKAPEGKDKLDVTP